MWQLISPALPVGAYAYSAGLETAAASEWVTDESSARAWILGQVRHSLSRLDIPVLTRLYVAWSQDDAPGVEHWSRYLLASRESSELMAEDRHLGSALARLLPELGIEEARAWQDVSSTSFAAMFALAAARWAVPLEEAAEGYLWAWCENQVAAAIKLIPLGQTAGQRILSAAIEAIAQAAEFGLSVADHDIGAVAPGLGIASALHETQYTRLFRS